MIYIVDSFSSYNYLEEILNILEIEYKTITPTHDEFKEILTNNNFDSMIVAREYQEILEELFPKKYEALLGIDLITKNKRGELVFYNTLYDGFSEFLQKESIDFTDKRILLLGSSHPARIIYKAIKDNSNATVYIASITEEPMDLKSGDRRIKKIEISNMQTAYCVINTTDLGIENVEDTCMLENKNVISAFMVIDLIINPYKTTLIRKYETRGSKGYPGLQIHVYRVLTALDHIFEGEGEKYMDRFTYINRKMVERHKDIKLEIE